MYCEAGYDDLGKFEGWSPLSPVCPLVGHSEYEAACQACEIHVVITSLEVFRLVVNSLEYSKTKAGPRGRALVRDLPTLGLLKHDRLEPTLTLLDVGRFEEQKRFPLRCTFWRRANETRVRRRCVLFCKEIGITQDIICIDLLHTLVLGPCLDWCCAVFWWLIDYNVFRVDGDLEKRISLTMLRVKDKLWRFFIRGGKPRTQGRL